LQTTTKHIPGKSKLRFVFTSVGETNTTDIPGESLYCDKQRVAADTAAIVTAAEAENCL